METASKETLYRVLVNHTNIIESQKAVLDTIEHEVKELKMRNIISKGKFRLDRQSELEWIWMKSPVPKPKVTTSWKGLQKGSKSPIFQISQIGSFLSTYKVTNFLIVRAILLH